MKNLLLLLALTPACTVLRPRTGMDYATAFCRNANGSTVKTVFANNAGTHVRCTNGSTITVEGTHE